MNRDFILSPASTQIEVVKNQAAAMLNVLMMLTYYENYSGMGEWLTQAERKMDEKRRAQNHLVMEYLYGAVSLLDNESDYLAYVHKLEAQDPRQMRDQVLEHLLQWAEKWGGPLSENILDDEETFIQELLNAYKQMLLKKHEEECGPADEQERRAKYLAIFPLLKHPRELQATVVEHLSWMWHNVLEAHWQEIEPLLDEVVSAFQKQDYSRLAPLDAVQAVAGRDLRNHPWGETISQARHIQFIITPEMGPYVSMFSDDSKLRLFCGARLPEGTQSDSSAVSRSELLVRLSALADDNRLRILEVIARQGEMCAQDVITELHFSQSAASRHLRQLSATGYLNERTRHGAKCYTLNTERVDQTLEALRHFFLL